MRRHLSTIILILIFLVGIVLLLYPTFSDWWNSFHQSRAVASYIGSVTDMNNEEYDVMLEEAREYNAQLARTRTEYTLTDEEMERYNAVLNVSGTGIMGYVDIPSIGVTLPIYHGTEEAVLQTAVGHIESTSLPVGGANTHCVISGHRGLPSARLFTDLDRLTTGDLFTLNVLDEVMTYEVDQILIVEPYDLSCLQIIPGKDLVTLVTCTPYGINTHRLLVRGHRIETGKVSNIRVMADAIQVDKTLMAVFIAVPVLLVLMTVVMITTGIRRRRNRRRILLQAYMLPARV
ncbi:MAG: class C sortase [Firmicutes bacterium]|nr:class C sortase [Bacillota bacterium]